MLRNLQNLVRFQTDDKGGDPPDNQTDPGAIPETFDSWLAKQSEETRKVVQPLYQERLTALENTVKATRKERDDFSRELRTTAGKLAADSDEKKLLLEKADNYDEANRRADFYEQAPANECRNAKAAYAIAKSQDLFTKSGLPDWKQIKMEAPELFGQPTNLKPRKTAGSGTDAAPTNAGSMNDWMRKRAGITPE